MIYVHLVRSISRVLLTDAAGVVYQLADCGLVPCVNGSPGNNAGPFVAWGVACCPSHFVTLGSYRISLN